MLLVILNYFSASFCGYYLAGTTPWHIVQHSDIPWIPIVIVGSVFVFTFFLIGETTRKSGIAVTTIAAKMSFVLPVAVSFLIDPNDKFSVGKAFLIAVALIAVILTVYKKNDEKQKAWLYPLLLFILLGFADSLVKYMQTHHIRDMQSTSLFAATLFTVSSFFGFVIWSFYGPNRKLVFKPLVLASGLALGVLNFGSLYFLVNALNSLSVNSSIVFGINNLGIVILSVTIAVIGYKEKLLTINKIGILISIIVVGLMMLSF